MRPLMRPHIEFAPYDIWIGVYLKRRFSFLTVYICVVPCFPIVSYWKLKEKNGS